jgi:Spy/CpxP family protein refolding chaperone
MSTARLSAFVFGLFLLAGVSAGQDKGKKDDPPAKDEPASKYKGQLPPNWRKLGLTDAQTQKVYKVNAKYGEEIAKLEAKIAELKEKRDKERFDILTAEQKKRLAELNKAKSGG